MSSFGDAGGLRVRPYAITGGRTRARTEVDIEAIVYLSLIHISEPTRPY